MTIRLVISTNYVNSDSFINSNSYIHSNSYYRLTLSLMLLIVIIVKLTIQEPPAGRRHRGGHRASPADEDVEGLTYVSSSS